MRQLPVSIRLGRLINDAEAVAAAIRELERMDDINDPAEFERFQRADTERWRRVTTAARIQPE